MNYLEQVQKLLQEKLENQSPQERLEMLNGEMMKENPSISLIEKLLQQGVGKKMTMEKVKETIEKNKIKLQQKPKKLSIEDANSLLIKEFQSETPNFEQVKLALDSGANPNVEFDFEEYERVYSDCIMGFSPLHICALKDLIDLAILLIERGADIHKESNNDVSGTPLHFTADGDFHSGSPNVAKLLIDNGADPYEENSNDYSPYEWAEGDFGEGNVLDNMIELFEEE